MRYAKAIAAGIGTLAATLGQALDDGHVSAEEVGGIAGAVAAVAFAVYAIRNKPRV